MRSERPRQVALSYRKLFVLSGGADRDRTGDLLNTMLGFRGFKSEFLGECDPLLVAGDGSRFDTFSVMVSPW